MFAHHPLVVVGAKEVEQGVHALLVMEELWRQVPVEELHTIANGLGQRRTREGRIEWLKVQLKNKVVVGAEIYKSKRLQTIIYDLNLFFLNPTSPSFVVIWNFSGKKSNMISLGANLYPSSTSCSLNCRYSGTLSSSTASSLTLTLTYSQTPGLGRMASATHGGITIASCKITQHKWSELEHTPKRNNAV